MTQLSLEDIWDINRPYLMKVVSSMSDEDNPSSPSKITIERIPSGALCRHIAHVNNVPPKYQGSIDEANSFLTVFATRLDTRISYYGAFISPWVFEKEDIYAMGRKFSVTPEVDKLAQAMKTSQSLINKVLRQ